MYVNSGALIRKVNVSRFVIISTLCDRTLRIYNHTRYVGFYTETILSRKIARMIFLQESALCFLYIFTYDMMSQSENFYIVVVCYFKRSFKNYKFSECTVSVFSKSWIVSKMCSFFFQSS